MKGLAHLLVALDGSPTSERAYDVSLDIARRYGSTLTLCTVFDRDAACAGLVAPDAYVDVGPILESYTESAKALLAQVLRRASEAGVSATTVLLQGRPAAEIAAYAAEHLVDAIVLGSEGKRGLRRAFLGSTAEGVLRASVVPTFVVNSRSGTSSFARILVALDDSDSADAAMSAAIALASSSRSRLLCCNVVEVEDLLDKAATYGYDPTPFLDEMHRTSRALVDSRVEGARERSVDADSIVVEGKPVDALLAAAADRNAGLIVIGTHGRRGLRRLLLGSVAENVVRRSDTPVLVVRAADSRSVFNAPPA